MAYRPPFHLADVEQGVENSVGNHPHFNKENLTETDAKIHFMDSASKVAHIPQYQLDWSYHQEGSPLKQLFMEDILHQKHTGEWLLSQRELDSKMMQFNKQNRECTVSCSQEIAGETTKGEQRFSLPVSS